MAEELVFYSNPMSRGRIARWMLEEVGAPYRTEWLTYEGSMKSPDYLAVNPMGKVPAIRHGKTVVLLLCGGDKASQVRDIEQAKQLWTEWKRRQR